MTSEIRKGYMLNGRECKPSLVEFSKIVKNSVNDSKEVDIQGRGGTDMGKIIGIESWNQQFSSCRDGRRQANNNPGEQKRNTSIGGKAFPGPVVNVYQRWATYSR